MGEASKKISLIWETLPDTDKKPYMDLSNVNKARHSAQAAEFKEMGYFTLADGTKSFEVK